MKMARINPQGVWTLVGDSCAQLLQHINHPQDVTNHGHVVQDDFLGAKQSCCQDSQCSVFTSAGRYGAFQALAADNSITVQI